MSRRLRVPPIAILSISMFTVGASSLLVLGLGTAMAQGIGFPEGQSGLLVTAFSIPYAIIAPLIQLWFGAKVNSRKLLIFGLLALALGLSMTCLVANFQQLLLARVVTAIGAAIISPSAFVIAMSLAKPGYEGRTTSALFLGFTLASLVAIPAATQIAVSYNWQTGFFLLSALCVVTSLLATLHLPSPSAKQVTMPMVVETIFHNRPLLLLYASIILHLTAQFVLIGSMSALLLVHFELSASLLPVAMLVFGTLGIVGNQLAGSLNDSFGPWTPLRFSSAGFALVALIFSFDIPSIAAVVCMAAFSFAANLFRPPQMTLMSKLVDPELRGIAMGFNNSSAYLGLAIGSAVNAIIVEAFGYGMLGWVTVAFLCASAVSIELVRRSSLMGARS